MTRLRNLLKGGAVAVAAVALSGGASAESLDALRTRAKGAAEPAEAIQVARGLRRAGASAEARTLLQKAFAKARGNDTVAALRLEISRTYVEEGLAKKALRECDQIHKLSAFTEQLCIAEGQLLSRRGSQALPAAEQALALQPDDYDSLVAKGRALMQLGQPKESESALRAAAEKARSRSDAPRFLAELLLLEGKQEAAIAALREACRAEADDAAAWLMLGTTLPSGAEARQALEQALVARPGFAPAEARLGQVLRGLGDLDGAERHLRAALASDPKKADWHAELGEVYIARHEADQALGSARAALEIVANHGGAKLVEAKALAEKGDIDLAIEAFESAYGSLRLEPRALLAAVDACVRGNRLTTARAFADRATQDFPKSAAAWAASGDVSVAAKDVPAARAAYDRALAGEGPADRDAIRRKRAALK